MIEYRMIELQDAGQRSGQTDADALRRVYGRFPTGVMAVCAMHDGDPAGFAASSFVVVSAEPPLVAVCVQRGSATWPVVSSSPGIGLSVLSAGQDRLCRQLAARGAVNRLTSDRFIGAGWSATANGAVLIEGATAWLECAIYSVSMAGDHELVLMKVRRHAVNGEVAPLVFHASGFRQLGAV
jgi:flavin reductase (DIM6/NTAB) family NADH-FMN oxidoreductase RutF